MDKVETIESIRHANMKRAENARRRRIEELTLSMRPDPTALCVNFANESACNSCKWHNFTCTDSVIK